MCCFMSSFFITIEYENAVLCIVWLDFAEFVSPNADERPHNQWRAHLDP